MIPRLKKTNRTIGQLDKKKSRSQKRAVKTLHQRLTPTLRSAKEEEEGRRK